MEWEWGFKECGTVNQEEKDYGTMVCFVCGIARTIEPLLTPDEVEASSRVPPASEGADCFGQMETCLFGESQKPDI